MARTRRHNPDDKPRRPRGAYRSKWDMPHKSATDYRRRPKHRGQQDYSQEEELEADPDEN